MQQSPLIPSLLTLDELESHLWEAANILRGSPVDRTDWKSYILPLLFFKRICDVWDEEYAAAVESYGEDFAEDHRFQIPEGCHWQRVRETPANVGMALQNAMRGIEVANQKHLYGVFGDAQWTNKERLPDPLLKDLIEHFSALNLGNQRITTDVIGDAYEYLIKKFADATNKKAGEFYTPRSVVRRHMGNPRFRALSERLESLKERHEQGQLHSIEFLKQLFDLARDLLVAEQETPPAEDEDRGKAALTELFEEVRTPDTPIIVERLVTKIDEIVRLVRFPGWQGTSEREREVRKALRKTLFDFKLHQDRELFDKAYGYVRQYY